MVLSREIGTPQHEKGLITSPPLWGMLSVQSSWALLSELLVRFHSPTLRFVYACYLRVRAAGRFPVFATGTGRG